MSTPSITKRSQTHSGDMNYHMISNHAKVLYQWQTRTWIFNAICLGHFCVHWYKRWNCWLWLFKRPVHKTLNANEYPYLLLYHMILFKSFHWSIRCHLISIISHIVGLKVILAPFNVGIIQTRLDYMSYNVGVLEEAETEHFGSPPDFWVGVVFLTFFTFCVVFCFVFYCFVVVLFCLFSSCVLRALCC